MCVFGAGVGSGKEEKGSTCTGGKTADTFNLRAT